MSHNSRMITKDYTLESTDGTLLQAVWSQPEGPVKATVVHVHGLGEHAGRADQPAHRDVLGGRRLQSRYDVRQGPQLSRRVWLA